jgi:hypothetical protein
VASIRVETEQETDQGWTYQVRIERDGRATTHTITLAWVDCEHWAGGRYPPSRVIEALVGLLVERESQRPIPDKFDAATARRWWPDLDGLLRSQIAR